MKISNVEIECTFESNLQQPDGEITMEISIRLKSPFSAQNEKLLDKLEIISDRVGEAVKRELFKHSTEEADKELVADAQRRVEKGSIKRMGTKRYTVKTIFGTVITARSRIKNKADSSTRIGEAWAHSQANINFPSIKGDSM